MIMPTTALQLTAFIYPQETSLKATTAFMPQLYMSYAIHQAMPADSTEI